MKVGSLFSGVGGFDLGFERAGFEIAWQVEIDVRCRKILDRHFQGIGRFSDVRECGIRNLRPVDVICGGFPCQDISVAGKRKGLAGERSGLFFEFIRIIDEMLPYWIVIENVAGILSSPPENPGYDLQTVLRELTGFCPEIPDDGWRNSGICIGPKRSGAWRVLDSRYFGVAQRRRRVFIVAGPGRSSAFEVLLNPTSGAWDSAPCREERQEVARAIARGSVGSGYRYDQNGEDFVLTAALNSGGNCGGFRTEPGEHIIAAPITASYGKQIDSSDRNGGPLNLVLRHDTNHEQRQLQQSEAWRSMSSTERERSSSGGSLLPQPQDVSETVEFVGVRAVAGISDWLDYHEAMNPEGQDSARYRALGNAVTVSVAYWIAKRIMEYRLKQAAAHPGNGALACWS